MSDQRYAVTIVHGDSVKQYSEQFQTQASYAAPWKAVLQKAHKQATVSCQCPGTGCRLLAVRHMSDNDSFHLSRYPRTGAEHALDCVYYSPDPDKSGLGSYSKGVVEETSEGDLKIKLTLSLRKKEPADTGQAPEATGSSSGSGKATKPAMTLLGLLHLLWNEAGLNTWSPGMAGKRGLGLVHSRLQDAADRMLASRMRIGDALVIAAGSKGFQSEANERKVKSAIKNNRRLLVIAPLAGHTEDREKTAARYLTITGFNGVPRMFLDDEIWSTVARRFKRELSAWRQGRRVIAIVQSDQPTEPGKAQALNVALMVVSDEWIPVESSYEAVIEARLREESRRFVKPLRFDSSEDQVFPDFWLMDASAGTEYPMEVYGRSDPKYLARKEVKATYYRTHYGTGWWAWDASSDPQGNAIPEFPSVRT